MNEKKSYKYILTICIFISLILPVNGWSDEMEDRAFEINQFGLECMRISLWGEAEYRFRQSLEILPDNAMIYNNLGVCLEAQNRLDEAYEMYKKANELAPDNDEIYDNLTNFMEIHKYEED